MTATPQPQVTNEKIAQLWKDCSPEPTEWVPYGFARALLAQRDQAGDEAVATVVPIDGHKANTRSNRMATLEADLPVGTKLYTHANPAQQAISSPEIPDHSTKFDTPQPVGEREKFEAWADNEGHSIARWFCGHGIPPGEYKSTSTEKRWESFQAGYRATLATPSGEAG